MPRIERPQLTQGDKQLMENMRLLGDIKRLEHSRFISVARAVVRHLAEPLQKELTGESLDVVVKSDPTNPARIRRRDRNGRFVWHTYDRYKAPAVIRVGQAQFTDDKAFEKKIGLDLSVSDSSYESPSEAIIDLGQQNVDLHIPRLKSIEVLKKHSQMVGGITVFEAGQMLEVEALETDQTDGRHARHMLDSTNVQFIADAIGVTEDGSPVARGSMVQSGHDSSGSFVLYLKEYMEYTVLSDEKLAGTHPYA